MVAVSSMVKLLALPLLHPPRLGQLPRLQLRGPPLHQRPLLQARLPPRLPEVRHLLELTVNVVAIAGLVQPPASQDTLVLLKTHVHLHVFPSEVGLADCLSFADYSQCIPS